MLIKAVRKYIPKLLSVLFWIAIWYLAAYIVDSIIILPTPLDTLKALFELLLSKNFYITAGLTLLNVLFGLSLGIFLGIILAVLGNKFSFVKTLLSPLISVIRATPVASFIILLWVLVRGELLPVVVAVLMVMPIVYQNTSDGFGSVDKELVELLAIYPVSKTRRFKALYLPILKGYIYPAVITSVGLAFKSEIAAEIISYTVYRIGRYTANSVGADIYEAKFGNEIPTVFAWTVVIILLSITLEMLAKKLLKGVKNEHKN